MLPVQKLNRLPIEPMNQVAKICVAFGMTRIKLKRAVVEIGGQPIIGFIVSSRGFDLVPFVGNMLLSPTDEDSEFDLEKVWSKLDESDDRKFH
tara:strand:- start:1148 stop:1426 length:279 start_codon:yes stop_codon:yes gene_type:complete